MARLSAYLGIFVAHLIEDPVHKNLHTIVIDSKGLNLTLGYLIAD